MQTEAQAEKKLDIAEGKIGEVGNYDVQIESGKIAVKVNASTGPVEAFVTVYLDAGKVLDAIAKKIPGTIDDAILGVAKAALLGA